MRADANKENSAEEKKVERMDCARFAEVLHDLDRPGSQGTSLCECALAHAEACSHCAALLTEVESLDFALRQVAEEASDLQAPPRVETLLLQEFRRQKSANASRGVRWQLAAFGAAAAVLLALGLSLHRQHLATPGGTAAAGVASTQSSGRAAGQAAGNADTTDAQSAAEPAAVAGSGDTEYATAFLPLPYADDPADLQGAAVVRVVLPRSTLAAYGLPVEGMNIGEQVTADMVVSQDGTPQAVRLVAQANADTDF
ncbi:MAG: hypothetical protein WA192_00890 [Candidatus Acidiferrales bacterium]